MDFLQLVRQRRSVRRFTQDPVPEADLRAMLEAARLAPSATNEQPWRFIVVRDRALLGQMRDVVSAMIEARLQEAGLSVGRRQRIEGMRYYATHFGDAPVGIFVLAHPYPAASPPPVAPYYDPSLQSVAAAIAFLHLAATALGYGSCWTTGPVDFAGETLEAMLSVEPPWRMVAVVVVGRTAQPSRERPRKTLEEIAAFVG